jgi:pSer/pThr/pTyr-binding forkhead associated (FHA) protein
MQGPHKNESIVIQKGAMEKVVLRSNPEAKSGDTHQLDSDASTDASHVRLELNISNKLCTVIATDLKSSSGTFVNSKPIGKNHKVFINDEIRIGATVMKVKPL